MSLRLHLWFNWITPIEFMKITFGCSSIQATFSGCYFLVNHQRHILPNMILNLSWTAMLAVVKTWRIKSKEKNYKSIKILSQKLGKNTEETGEIAKETC